MKKVKSILVGIVFFALSITNAQTISQTGIASPPLVDPETNCALRYYYYPNLQAYFDTKKNVYIYSENGEWKEGDDIPNGYRGYSLYNKVNVYISDYDDDNITQFINEHKKKYPYISAAKAKITAMLSQRR